MARRLQLYPDALVCHNGRSQDWGGWPNALVSARRQEDGMTALVESDNQIFYEVLGEVVLALDGAKIEYAMMGGIAATILGGHRFTHDIDIFVKPAQAGRALESLGNRGFDIEKTDPRWLYKAFKKNVMVDLIFKSSGPVYLDDEMYERSTMAKFNCISVRTLSPEDL